MIQNDPSPTDLGPGPANLLSFVPFILSHHHPPLSLSAAAAAAAAASAIYRAKMETPDFFF